MPGSSVAEQVTVNHLVVGSTPTRAATLAPETYKSFWGFFGPKNNHGVRFVSGFFTPHPCALRRKTRLLSAGFGRVV